MVLVDPGVPVVLVTLVAQLLTGLVGLLVLHCLAGLVPVDLEVPGVLEDQVARHFLEDLDVQ